MEVPDPTEPGEAVVAHAGVQVQRVLAREQDAARAARGGPVLQEMGAAPDLHEARFDQE